MTLTEKEIAERVAEGEIHCLVTLEVAGKPGKHVEETLTQYVEIIKKEPALEVIRVEQESAVELDGDDKGFFSAFAEVELVVPKAETLVSIAITLTPASIEILAPDTFSFGARDMQNWLNDLLSQLHQVSHTVRGERQKSTYLSKSVDRLLQNFLTVLLLQGGKDVATLHRMSGVEEAPLKKVLSSMQEQGLVSEEDGTWTLISSEK